MKTLVCYRVEHRKTEVGPLSGCAPFYHTEVTRYHPGIYGYDDWNIYNHFENCQLPENYIFGTKTKRTMKSIFLGWKKKKLLKKSGYRLYRMHVKADSMIKLPDGQVIFPRESVVSKEKIAMK